MFSDNSQSNLILEHLQRVVAEKYSFPYSIQRFSFKDMETVPHKFHGPQIETWDRTVSLET